MPLTQSGGTLQSASVLRHAAPDVERIVTGSELQIDIHTYGDRNGYLMRYKDDANTKVQRSVELTSGEAPVFLDFAPMEARISRTSCA